MESFVQSTGAYSFYGFAGIVFDQIRVEIAGVGPVFGVGPHMRFDNLQIGAAAIVVPEPTTLVLICLGLIAIDSTACCPA